MIKLDVGMSPCISYHHYYPCFVAFCDCDPTLKLNFDWFHTCMNVQYRSQVTHMSSEQVIHEHVKLHL